ncbi:MAG: IPT/TIG domain-containing protein [Myxococcota bacterium]
MNKWELLGRWTALIGTGLSMACGGEVLVPTIDGFSPLRGTIGAEISISGRHFERDGKGYLPASGTQPWQVFLVSGERRYALTILDQTSSNLVVQVPEGASGGLLALADADGIISETTARFEVLSPPLVRVVNDAQYDVVDLRFNGVQALADGRVLESGSSLEVAVNTDRYRVDFGIGEPKAVWIRGQLHDVESGDIGTEIEVHVPTLGPIDFMTDGGAPTDWVASYRTLDDKAATMRLRIYGDATWALFSGDLPVGQGSLIADPIAAYARSAQFRLNSTGPAAKTAPPFQAFDLENGPSHWTLLHYTRVQ